MKMKCLSAYSLCAKVIYILIFFILGLFQQYVLGQSCSFSSTAGSQDFSNTLTSTITITGLSGNITDINVKDLSILHTWVGDIKATLTSPNNITVVLFDRPGIPASTFGCSGNDMLVTLDDEAASQLENVCNVNSPAISGTYQPVNPLSAFDGVSPNGTWTLTIIDNFVGGDNGSLQSWSLQITAPQTYYVDHDNDTYGNPSNSQLFTCNPGAGYSTNSGDCNDNNADIHPGATEICNGFDDNCNNQVDEGNVCCPAGGILYVKANATGLNNGISWANAFTSLQSALASPCPGITQIWVAAGTYYPDEGAGQTNNDRNASFTMKHGVAIYGGFPNTGNPTLTDRNWATNPTILSGDIDQNDAGTGNANNSYHVIFNNVLDAGNDAILDGFTVTGGNANKPQSFEGMGGGMYSLLSESVVIRNCIFSANYGIEGGGVRIDYGQATFINCIFIKNAAQIGGAILNQFALLTMNNCDFYGNAAPSGEVIYNLEAGGYYGTNSFSNCILWNNGDGTGILASSNRVVINNSIVQGGYSSCSGCPNTNGNVDPLFVDAANGNLRLQPCSPAINAGDPTTTSATAGNVDLAGNSRFYNNGRVDLGAFEYQGNAVAPTANASTTTAVICVGNTINLSASGGSNFSWAGPSGSNFSSTEQNPSFVGSSTSYSGLYTVSVSNQDCPLTATATVSVKVNANPTAGINPSGTSICAGGTINLNGTGGSSYSWNASGGSFTSNTGSPTTWSTSTSGAYTISVTATSGTCTATSSLTATVNTNPTAGINPSGTSICAGGSINLNGTGGSSYSWNASGGTFNSTTNQATFSSSIAGGFSISVTVANGFSCTASATASVTVVTQPTASISPSATQIICQGQALNLTASGGGPYSWSGPGNFNSTNAIANINTSSTSNSGIYQVLVGTGVCTATATVSVQINSSITVSVSFAPVCLVGNPLNLSASGGDEYRWRGPNSFTSTSATPTKAKTVAKDEGVYSITVTGNGVCTVTSTIRVYYGIGAGEISISNRSPYCKGGPISLTATAAGASSYRWSKQFGTATFTGNPVTITPNAKTSDGGVYTVFVTGQNGCIEKQETLVTVSQVACMGTRLANEEGEEIDMEINAYPNPVTNTLTVEVRLKEASKLSLSLFNSVGKESGSWQLNEEVIYHKTELNMSELQGGLYLLQAQAGKQKVVKRVVKIQY